MDTTPVTEIELSYEEIRALLLGKEYISNEDVIEEININSSNKRIAFKLNIDAKKEKILNSNIKVLGLSLRVSNSLNRAHIDTINQLVQKTSSDLYRANVRLGALGIQEIERALKKHNLALTREVG